MNIKVDNKKVKIKPFSELTVKEYIKLFEMMKPESTHIDLIINYISIVSGIDYQKVTQIKIDNDSIRRILAFIGQVYVVSKFPIKKEFHYLKTNEIFKQKEINWRTLGVRKLIEERKTDNQIELAVYLLAVLLSKNYDAKTIQEIYSELQEYPASEVFGFSVFFLRNLYNGNKPGLNFLRMLKKKVLTSTKISSSSSRVKG